MSQANLSAQFCLIGRINNISTTQFFTGISRNTQSKANKILTLTKCVWKFPNDALWDTHYCALFILGFRLIIISTQCYFDLNCHVYPNYLKSPARSHVAYIQVRLVEWVHKPWLLFGKRFPSEWMGWLVYEIHHLPICIHLQAMACK